MWPMLSVVGPLEAARQRVGVLVVEQTVVSISPGESLGADTQVRIWHKFWLFVGVRLHLQVDVGNADGNTR